MRVLKNIHYGSLLAVPIPAAVHMYNTHYHSHMATETVYKKISVPQLSDLELDVHSVHCVSKLLLIL